LRHDVGLEGFAFRLRPVELGDAADIVDLRRDPDRSRFIHETPPSVEAQVRWLEDYFRRDGDHYWAVERLSDGRTEGFLGLYDVDGDRAEWGRWVLRPGSLAAAESAWLVHEAASDRWGWRH
jgi:RimJ/RimL family protein N-acetyltransferase